MRKLLTTSAMLLVLIAPLAPVREAGAGPDQYLGDSAIYTNTSVRPNVLFVIDNSAAMEQAGATRVYDPDYLNHPYPGTFIPDAVYVRETATGGTINYNLYISSINSVGCTSANTQLINTGAYYGKLKKDGSCNAAQPGEYVMGNLINYIKTPIPVWQANTAYTDGDVVVPTAGSDISYLAMASGVTGTTAPAWSTTLGVNVTDNTVVWQMSPDSIIGMVQATLKQVSQAVRNRVNVGVMVFGNNNSGGKVVKPVKEITDLDSAGRTNLIQLLNSVDQISLLTANSQPVNEALWDAGVYYGGNNSDSHLKISSDTVSYPSPIQYSCQKNFIIVLTTGATDPTDQTTQSWRLPTDLSGNHVAGDSADAAIHNYTPGVFITFDGVSRSIPLTTYVIQLLTPSIVPILQDAATFGGPTDDSTSRYAHVHNTTELTQALLDAMSSAVNSADTAFVAPVVPVSPENKVYTGSRVYMGFFKPISDKYWYGNLKKYAIDANYNIVDANNNFATYVDENFDYQDDRDGAVMAQPAQNGSFRPDALSIWSASTSTADAGRVDAGGAGAMLQDRDFSVSSPTGDITGNIRKIYTYLGTNTNLIHDDNAFKTTNDLLTSATSTVLGLPGAMIITTGTTDDKKKLVNFVHGINVYSTTNNTAKRPWIFGDVLHSKPIVMNYASYTFTPTTEADCTINKSMIFVGSNDGMLHAINDCDGSEAWAFIPPDLLPYLYYIHGSTHTYFVDSTIYDYVYDHNQNGTIEPSDGDKVVLILGLRRGGGIFGAEPTSGFYYALDVSDPSSPVFLWSISNSSIRKGTTTTASTDFADLGEAWSEPKIARIRAQTSYDPSVKDRIAIFIGGGYDNCNEDSRYGATQKFSGTCVSTTTTDDGGLDINNLPITSAPNTDISSLSAYKGRAVYAVELAALNAGVPDITNGSNLIRAFTTPGYAMVSEMTAIDRDFDGYVDTLYMGDAGGNMWRFSVGSTDPGTWTATKIFSFNPGYTNGSADGSPGGRKIFYKPSAVVDIGPMVRLYFGTGDREHPLNRAVTDRMYGVIDKGQTSAVTEAQLVDVTDDLLQLGDPTSAEFQTLLANLNKANDSTNTDYYGWYIRLDQNSGEKVLAPALVFNKAVYLSTYSPITEVNPDPCQFGNPGTARVYVLDYQNGNAVMNFDTSNDSSYATYRTNSYATPASAGGKVLLRTDRVERIGLGIPSGVVVTGDKVLIGCGGGICTTATNPGGQVLPLYWRQR